MPKAPKYLFSYGSNSPRQLRERLGHPVTGQAAYAPGWKRVFRGYSHGWAGGVASMERAPAHATFGFVAPVSVRDLSVLDQYEGVARGNYKRHTINVATPEGDRLKAIAYLATSEEFNEPSEDYLAAVAETIGNFWRESDGSQVTKKAIPVRNPPNPVTAREFPYYARGTLFLTEPDPDNRTVVPVDKIGKGAFSMAFLTKTGTPYVYLLTKEGASGDYSKEMLSHLDPSPYLPRVVALGCMADDETCVYRMPFYKAPLKKAHGEQAWKQYRALAACHKQAEALVRERARAQQGPKYYTVWDQYGHDIMQATLNCAESHKDVPPGLFSALDSIVGNIANYGTEYTFEFSPRNLATTDAGHLVLLDTTFSVAAIRRVRDAKAAKVEARARRY